MNCNQCGATMIKSQRTGKMYCSDRCWLKNQPQSQPQGDSEVMNALRKVYDKLNEIEALCNSINFKVGKESLVNKKRMDIPETNEQEDMEYVNKELSDPFNKYDR